MTNPHGSTSAAPKRPKTSPTSGPEVKVYLVLVPVRVPQNGRPNFKIVASKLTRQAAEEVQALIPDSRIQKVTADKRPANLKAITQRL